MVAGLRGLLELPALAWPQQIGKGAEEGAVLALGADGHPQVVRQAVAGQAADKYPPLGEGALQPGRAPAG